MAWSEFLLRASEAGKEFNKTFHQTQGEQTAQRLAEGQLMLCESLYARLHDDVQRIVGVDSMFMPISEQRSQRQTKSLIELFQVAEATDWAGQSAYLGAEIEPFWRWILRQIRTPLPPDSDAQQVESYLAQSPRERRLTFSNVLAKAFPESRRAPLVLFRLFPLAVRLSTSLAFGDEPAADQLRAAQCDDLPAILDCHACHGKILAVGDLCRECGNPLWKGETLNSGG